MSLQAAQTAIEELGGVHNVHVARLFRSERFLLVEGDDIPLLGALQQTAIPTTRVALATIPAYETGGWGGWHHAIASTLPAKNGEGKRIENYCIFDRDFHTDEEIAGRYAEADRANVHLHVWRRKELENYVVCAPAIDRLIRRGGRKRRRLATGEVEEVIEQTAAALLEDTIDSLADELQRRTAVWESKVHARRQETWSPTRPNAMGWPGLYRGRRWSVR
jgi:hypothetical protein